MIHYNRILGNASEIDKKEIEEKYSEFLIEEKDVQKAYKLIRDMFIFTNKRLILVDKQGITGKSEFIVLHKSF